MADLSPELIKDLTSALNGLALELDNISLEFRGLGREAQIWDDVLDQAAKTLKDLPKSISGSADLWSQMCKDAEFFHQVEGQIKDMAAQEMQAAFKQQVDILNKRNATSEEFAALESQQTQKTKSFNKILEKRLNLAKQQAKSQKDINKQLEEADKKIKLMNKKFVDANSLAKDLGNLIRDPGAGMEKLLAWAGELPTKLRQATEKAGGLSAVLMKMGAAPFVALAKGAKLLFSPAGLLMGGIAAATGAATVFFMLYRNFYGWMDKEVIPAIADFNKGIGGSGAGVEKLRSQATDAGAEFQLLGMSFKEGAELVTGFAQGMKQVVLSSETLKIAKSLVAVVGVGAQEAGQFAMQFQKQEGNLKNLSKAFTYAEKEADAYGVPVREVQKDMANSPDVLARFGTANAIQFAKATVHAQRYGMSVRDLESAFGDQLDTFDATSRAAANLNAIFGTSINSFELLQETDITKRFEMIRKELEKNIKPWKDISVAEKKFLADTLKVSQSQLTMMFGSKKLRAEEERRAAGIRKQQAAQESMGLTVAKWNKGLGQVTRTLFAWGAQLDAVMRSATKFTFALFGMGDPFDETMKGVDGLRKGFEGLNTTFEDWTKMLNGEKEANNLVLYFQTGVETVKDFWGLLKGVAKTITVIGAAIFDALVYPFKVVWNFVSRIVDTLSEFGTFFKTIAQGNFKGALSAFDTKMLNPLEHIKSIFYDDVNSATKDVFASMAESAEDEMASRVGSKSSIKTPKPVALAQAKAAKAAKIKQAKATTSHQPTGPERNKSGGPEKVQVEIMDMNIDGRKVGEAVVRVSRG